MIALKSDTLKVAEIGKVSWRLRKICHLGINAKQNQLKIAL